ncbi:hypothetical protein Btru_034665 [Bulinus truncatus]|nr:hypothetical protein Btru_034665 [Bulinus truncatus]
MELHPSSKSDFEVKLWHQLVLSSALFTNEVAITYELIYMVTWEKLLGLPGQYVTLPGVISAVVSFILIPIMGRLGDRGNRLKMKCLLVILSGGCMVLGASCLLLGCILKLSVVSVFDSQMNCSMLLNNSVSVNTEILPSNQSSVNKTRENCTHISDTDTGFDTGGSNIRSFMLECVEKSQHSKMLYIGVIMSGLGGCAISALGLLDVNLSQSMDPNLVKAMMLSLFLIVSVVATVPATLICGRYL